MFSPRPFDSFEEMGAINLEQEIAQARTRLDRTAFEAGYATGQSMTKEQAISYAL